MEDQLVNVAAPLETDSEDTTFMGNEQAVPMHERVILAFLARPSKVRAEDQSLIEMLSTQLAKEIGYVLTHPDKAQPTEKISRLAERLFLDAGNIADARKIRASREKNESEREQTFIEHVHAAAF